MTYRNSDPYNRLIVPNPFEQFTPNLDSEEAKEFGIRPEEAELVRKTHELIARRDSSFIPFIGSPLFNSIKSPSRMAGVKENDPITAEEKKLVLEWCQLNERLLNEFYSGAAAAIDRQDYSLLSVPPSGNHFPFASIKWVASSTRWGRRNGNEIVPISGSGYSVNEALHNLKMALDSDKAVSSRIELEEPW